jgi:hypothetical protein
MIRFFSKILVSVFFFASVASAQITQNAMENVETYFSEIHGVVVQVDGKNVLVDLGVYRKIVEGLKLNVFQDGEKIIHPITGKLLGVKKAGIGRLTVTEVHPEFSITEYEGEKMPQPEDQVGLILPVPIRVVLDNGTAEDDTIIKNMLLANPVLKLDNDNYTHTLQMQKTRDAMNYQVVQKDGGAIILSDTVARQYAAPTEGMAALGRTELPKGRFYSIAVGRIYKNDSKLYMLGVNDSNELYVLDMDNGYSIKEEIKFKYSELITVELADLDQDGVDEIFLNNTTRTGLKSMIIKDSGNGFATVATDLKWLFRSIRQPEIGGRKIVAQAVSNNGEYSGEIYNFVYANGTYAADKAIPGTLGKRVMGFSMIAQENGADDLLLNIGRGNSFFLSTFKKIEFTAPGYFGDTFHILLTGIKEEVRSARLDDEGEERMRYIEKRIYINPRIEIFDKDNFVIAQNDLMSRTFIDSQVFSSSTLHLFSYKNSLLRNTAKFENLEPVIADVWVYEKDGETYVAVLNSNNNWAFQFGKSSITLFSNAGMLN